MVVGLATGFHIDHHRLSVDRPHTVCGSSGLVAGGVLGRFDGGPDGFHHVAPFDIRSQEPSELALEKDRYVSALVAVGTGEMDGGPAICALR